jgi:XrtJ-associated TM-motif-TM protein
MHRNRISLYLIIAASIAVFAPKTAFALIGGCVDSPEDPTVVMAILGVGAAAAPIVWSRLKSRRNTK